MDDIDIFDDPNRDPLYEEMGFSFDNERGQYFEVVSHPEYGVMRRYISPRDQSPVPELSDARVQADLLSKFSKNNVRGLSDATMKLALNTAAKEIDLFDEVGAETFGDLEKRALNLVDKLRSGRVTITPTELEEDYSRLRSKIRDEKGLKGLTKGRGYKEGGGVGAPNDRKVDKSMFRSDGSKKSATGFLGPIKNLVTGGTMTEFTTNWEDAGIEIPTMVPTLSAEEVEYMRRMKPGQGWDRSNPMDASILSKAKDHARMRIKQGKSPYYQDGEDQAKQMRTGGIVDNVDIFGYVGGGSVAKELLDLAKTTGKTQKERVKEDFPVEVYHGTDSAEDIDIFDPDAGTFLRRNTGTFVTESPTQASTYGKSVMPLQINDADFAVADFNGNWDSASEDAVLYLPDGEEIEIGFMNTDDVARLARSKGVAGVRFDGVTDLGGRRYPDMNDAVEDYMSYGDYQYAVFDPTRIKSRFAVGDPSEKNTGQIMKSVGGLGSATGLGLLAASEEAEAGPKGGVLDLIVKGDFDPRFDPRKKEQDMLRNLEAEIIGSNYTQPMPRLALSDLEGEDFVTSMSDRTRAGGDVKSINRVELVDPIHLPGGQDFMFNNPSAVWASAEMPSRQILEMARDLKSQSGRDPLYIPWRMAPSGGDFSTTTGELMLGYAAANMTKATKKALDKAIRSYRTTGSMAKGKRVGAGRKIEGWKGIDDPSSVAVWRNTPDPVRKELMNMMDVQFRDKGGLSIGAARLINADPKQLTAKDAGIQNVGRIFADIDIFDSAHPSYPFAVPGGGVGVLENASAATVFDLLPKARFGDAQKKVKDPANPTQQEIRALQMKPYGGTITEDILRRMEARGVDVNSIAGLTGGALTFTLLSAGLVTPQEVQAGALKDFANNLRKADEMGLKTDQILYHGSTFDIEEFVPSSATDNDFGQGTYLTISPSDASRNYAGEGPDLTNRINTLSESIQESLEGDWGFNAEFWDKINDPEVSAKIEKLVDEFEDTRDSSFLEEASYLAAKTILKGQNEGVIYPVFVNNKDFAVIGGKNRTVIPVDTEKYMKSAKEEIDRDDFLYEQDYDDAVIEYAQELENNDYESPIAELADSLRSAGARKEAVDEAVLSAMESGQIDLTEINDIVRGFLNPDFDTGELLNNGQVVQDVLANLGYKGVVDNTVGQRFAGMGAGKMHTIVFPGNENLIRSINAKFDPAEAGSPNILASAPPILAPTALGIGALGSMQEARADALAAEGAGTEVILDALSGIASPIAGGVAGLLEYLSPVDRFKEGKGQRIREAREGVADALDYEPRSELAKEMKQQALQGISTAVRPVVETVAPIARDFKDYITDPENVMDDYGLNLLPSAYQAGSYLYENIFGEPEREATKSAMDVVL